jgi:DNA recombination protein RmuC
MAEFVEYATLVCIILLMLLVLWFRKEPSQLSPILDSNNIVTETYQKMQADYIEMKNILAGVQVEITASTQGRQEVIDFSRDLSDILKKPSLRGDVGEKLLEEMCKDYLPDSAWERQKVTNDEASSQKGGVDVLIKTNVLSVPVDSKFPREAWTRYANLAEEKMGGMSQSQKDNHRNNIKAEFEKFQKSVLDKVNEIQKHINPSSGTTDFALMFIPSEAMYYSVVSDKNAINEENIYKGEYLLESMYKKGVIPISPSIFYPFIQLILVSMKNMKIVDNLEDLQKKLNQFDTKLGTFSTAYEEIGKGLVSAMSAWETTGKRYNDLTRAGKNVTNALEQVEVKNESNDSAIDESQDLVKDTLLTSGEADQDE